MNRKELVYRGVTSLGKVTPLNANYNTLVRTTTYQEVTYALASCGLVLPLYDVFNVFCKNHQDKYQDIIGTETGVYIYDGKGWKRISNFGQGS